VKRGNDDYVRHSMAGDIAFAEHRYADAAQEYRLASEAFEFCVTCIWPREAHAYDLAGQPDSAIALFSRYVESTDAGKAANPWDQGTSADASYLAASYQRLGELWEQKNDRAKAARYYQKFVELWKNADPELQPKVADVRRRLARLSGAESR
jgi:tetratricopeptide (TPR) repeat protein